MKDSIRRKLEKLDERFEEVGRLLSDAGVISKQNQFRELSMEYSRLEDLVGRYRRFLALEGDAATAKELAADKDPATRAMGEEELADRVLNARHRSGVVVGQLGRRYCGSRSASLAGWRHDAQQARRR